VAPPHRAAAALVDRADDPEQAQARVFILRHEQAHVRRRDPLLALLLQLACCLPGRSCPCGSPPAGSVR
jgi:hypothetical protein